MRKNKQTPVLALLQYVAYLTAFTSLFGAAAGLGYMARNYEYTRKYDKIEELKYEICNNFDNDLYELNNNDLRR